MTRILGGEESATLRDHLLRQLDGLQSIEDITNWAQQSISAKNKLMASDALLVEVNFGLKLAEYDSASNDPPREQPETAQTFEEPAGHQSPEAITPEATAHKEFSTRRRPVAAKTIRVRDKDHRRFVSLHPCLICGRSPADAHHLRFAQPSTLGRKVSDEFTVPVCRVHHRELHRHGDESAWWGRMNIDPLPVALRLWQHSRPNGKSGSNSSLDSGDESLAPLLIELRSQ